MDTSDKKPSAPAPESRFTVSPMTLAADRWMGRLIRFGGVGVVLAVFGMLAFLIFQVFPLFIGATVAPISALTVPATAMGFGEDEYGELPFVVLADGSVVFQRSKDGTKALDWAPSLGAGRRVTAVRTSAGGSSDFAPTGSSRRQSSISSAASSEQPKCRATTSGVASPPRMRSRKSCSETE